MKLNSDANIDWNKYISIMVGGLKVDVSTATITLLAGDTKVNGTCSYKVVYTYNDKEYSKVFNVDFEYSKPTPDPEPEPTPDPEPEPTPTPSGTANLTAEQKTAFLAACEKDYSNVTITEDFYGSNMMFEDDIIYMMFYDMLELYVKKVDGKYQVYGENGWEVNDDFTDDDVLTFNFDAIDIEKVKYDSTNKLYYISADDLDIEEFSPFFVAKETTYLSYKFSINNSGYFDKITIVNVFEEETYDSEVELSDIGTTTIGEPTYNPPLSEETLGALQEYGNGDDCDVCGIIVGITAKGFLLMDLEVDEYVYVFTNKAPSVSLYDVVEVSGKIETYGGVKQIASPEISDMNATEEIEINPTLFKGDALTEYVAEPIVGQPALIVGKLAITKGSGNKVYYNVEVEDTNVIVSICYPTIDLSEYDNEEVEICGYLICVTGSSTKYANIIVDSIQTTKAPELGEATDLTNEQKALWNAAVSADYSTSIITESFNSITQTQKDGIYQICSFDEDGYVSLEYYKYISNKLNNYTFSGWEETTSNPLLEFKFSMLSSLTNKVKYLKETETYDDGAGNETTELNEMYYLAVEDLPLSEFIPAWKNQKAYYVAFVISENEKIEKVILIQKENGQEVRNFAQIIVPGSDADGVEINLKAPEESCNEMSILDVQFMVTDQLCTVKGIVTAITKTGFLLGDEENNCAYVYVSLGSTPNVELGHEVKVFGIASGCGTSLQFEKESCEITDLGLKKVDDNPDSPAVEISFDPEIISFANFYDYFDNPIVGLEVSFLATVNADKSLKVESLDYPVEFIDLKEDLTNFVNKSVLVNGYLMYYDSDDDYQSSFTFHLVLRNLIEETQDPLKADITAEDKTKINQAFDKNYSNYTAYEGMLQTTTYLTTNGILVEGFDEEGNKASYELKKEGNTYKINEGDGWQTITEEEYLAYAIIIDFSKINLEKVVKNLKTGFYEISAEDLDIEDFIPYFVDEDTIYESFQFSINEDGFVDIILLSNFYDGGYYLDGVYLSDFGTTTLNN